jgi:hypothetical protein
MGVGWPWQAQTVSSASVSIASNLAHCSWSPASVEEEADHGEPLSQVISVSSSHIPLPVCLPLPQKMALCWETLGFSGPWEIYHWARKDSMKRIWREGGKSTSLFPTQPLLNATSKQPLVGQSGMFLFSLPQLHLPPPHPAPPS